MVNLVELDGKTYYVTGDTDATSEAELADANVNFHHITETRESARVLRSCSDVRLKYGCFGDEFSKEPDNFEVPDEIVKRGEIVGWQEKSVSRLTGAKRGNSRAVEQASLLKTYKNR